MQTQPAHGVAPQRGHTLFVVGLALLTRVFAVGYALRHYPAGWFFTRGTEMSLLAKSLLAGEGLGSPFGPPTGPSAMIAPGYPVFVAGVFRVFGVESAGSAMALMGVHLALNLVTVWLVLRLARWLAGERAAVLAAVFWAVSPVVFFMPTIFWETNFSACFLISFVALALELRVGRGVGAWIGGGVVCAVAGLFNPALLPSLMVLGMWAAFRSRAAAYKTVLASVVFVVVFSPWPVRNARVFHAVVLTRTTVGFELWMGNRAGADGFLDESLFPTFNVAELAEYRARGELGYFAHKGALAKEYVREHPVQSIGLTLRRVARFWSGTGSRDGSALFALHALATTLLGLAGLVFLARSGRRNEAMFFLIPLALFPLPYYLTHAEFRYRLVVDPLLCVLAAVALRGKGSAAEAEGELDNALLGGGGGDAAKGG